MSFFLEVMATPGRQGVELVQLGLQQLLVRQAGLVFGDQRGRQRAAEGVFDHLAGSCWRRAARRWTALVRLLHVAVEGLQVEVELAEVLGLELADLQLEGDQAIEPSVEEEQIEGEVPAADLERVPRCRRSRSRGRARSGSGAGCASRLRVQIGLRVTVGQVEELDQVGVAEDGLGVGVQSASACRDFWRIQHARSKRAPSS